jgi:hypothetical protein
VHGTLTLLRHSFRRLRTLVAVLAAVLLLFQVLLVRVAAALQESAGFGRLAAFAPPFVRNLAGESLLSFASFSGIVCFGYFHPMIIAALSALVTAVATEIPAEIETRFVDAVLVRPVPRAALVTRSVVLLVLLPAAVLLAMTAGTAAGLRWLAPAGVPLPGAALIGSLALNLWALLVAIGGAALAVGAASRRRSLAGSAVGVAALALFLVDYLARSWDPAKAVAWVSPFHYSQAMDLIVGRPLSFAHLGVLLGIGVAGAAIAFVVFLRRDL